MQSPALTVERVTKRYGNLDAVDAVSPEGPAGSFTTLAGTNKRRKSGSRKRAS